MKSQEEQNFDYDYVIIGSGFGGSVSALRLSEKGYRVCVLEKGLRYSAKDFPKTNWNLFKYLWIPFFRCFGIQQLSFFKNIFILSGTGVGGGSLVYANTLLMPNESFYSTGTWSGMEDWKSKLEPFYLTAKKMLGVTQNRTFTEADRAFKAVANEMGCGASFKATDVGVFFGKPGQEGVELPDPYFNGKGPARAGCTFCGGCMVGCQHNAKNTLDKNYLHLAEREGALVQSDSTVRNIIPLSSGGYQIDYTSSTSWIKKTNSVRARGIIVSAGVLGTLSLLFRCKEITKTLPKLSPRLGCEIRTNSEALVGITSKSRDANLSKGIAISSGFYPEPHTHIEVVRYPKGSSFMRLLAVPMADGGNFITRPLKMVATFFFHFSDYVRVLFSGGWAERSVILLVMQTLDHKIRFTLGRSIFTLFRRGLTTTKDTSSKLPSYIPIGHVVARALAKKLNAIPQSAFNEVLLQIPTTAHILGGCTIGKDSSQGVIDSKNEVFGYPNMYVCDGSMIPANLGVNPSLTITAMSEHCMSMIPPVQENASLFRT